MQNFAFFAKFCVFCENLFIFPRFRIPNSEIFKIANKKFRNFKKHENFAFFSRNFREKNAKFSQKKRKISRKNAKFHNFAFYREILRFFLKFRLFLKNIYHQTHKTQKKTQNFRVGGPPTNLLINTIYARFLSL